MSKGTRKREANAAKKQLKLEREAFEAKKAKVRKVTAIITATLLIAVILAIVIGMIASTVRLNRGEYLRSEIAASSTNIDVDGAMMNYFFNDSYLAFLNYYGSYVSYYGLDPALPLKSQNVSENETWFEYFMDGARQNVSDLLMINEAAAADGVALTDEETAAIRGRADEIDTALYGKGTNRDDIYNAKLIEALAYKYQLAKEAELTPTDDEIDAYYAENSKNYQFVDYLSLKLSYIDSDSDETTTATLTEDEVKALTDKLAAATDEESFKALAKEAIRESEPAIPDEDLDNRVADLATAEAAYTADDFSEWAFGEAEIGETHTVIDETAHTYTVYMLTAKPYRSETETINVRHILLTDGTYGKREKALKAAEKLLEEFKAGEATADAFALLALEYSEDTGSYYAGGRYENVLPGQMVESFDAWCFDDTRAVGDTGIVETDYGVHIMYYGGDGKAEWQASVANTIVSEGLNSLVEEWSKKYTVAFDDTVLNMIPD
ncbi:MAG: peptidylprolyl isomerase [Clostridia bacterium]|nr:peptidylprolyl isomerase [Clostridia bacterium]